MLKSGNTPKSSNQSSQNNLEYVGESEIMSSCNQKNNNLLESTSCRGAINCEKIKKDEKSICTFEKELNNLQNKKASNVNCDLDKRNKTVCIYNETNDDSNAYFNNSSAIIDSERYSECAKSRNTDRNS